MKILPFLPLSSPPLRFLSRSFLFSLPQFLKHLSGAMLSPGDMWPNEIDTDFVEGTSSENVTHYIKKIIKMNLWLTNKNFGKYQGREWLPELTEHSHFCSMASSPYTAGEVVIISPLHGPGNRSREVKLHTQSQLVGGGAVGPFCTETSNPSLQEHSGLSGGLESLSKEVSSLVGPHTIWKGMATSSSFSSSAFSRC